jgi:hypothetical protein
MGGAVRKGIQQKAHQPTDKNYYINNWRLMRLLRSSGGRVDSVSVRLATQLYEVTNNYSISEMIQI